MMHRCFSAWAKRFVLERKNAREGEARIRQQLLLMTFTRWRQALLSAMAVKLHNFHASRTVMERWKIELCRSRGRWVAMRRAFHNWRIAASELKAVTFRNKRLRRLALKAWVSETKFRLWTRRAAIALVRSALDRWKRQFLQVVALRWHVHRRCWSVWKSKAARRRNVRGAFHAVQGRRFRALMIAAFSKWRAVGSADARLIASNDAARVKHFIVNRALRHWQRRVSQRALDRRMLEATRVRVQHLRLIHCWVLWNARLREQRTLRNPSAQQRLQRCRMRNTLNQWLRAAIAVGRARLAKERHMLLVRHPRFVIRHCFSKWVRHLASRRVVADDARAAHHCAGRIKAAVMSKWWKVCFRARAARAAEERLLRSGCLETESFVSLPIQRDERPHTVEEDSEEETVEEQPAHGLNVSQIAASSDVAPTSSYVDDVEPRGAPASATCHNHPATSLLARQRLSRLSDLQFVRRLLQRRTDELRSESLDGKGMTAEGDGQVSPVSLSDSLESVTPLCQSVRVE